MAAILAITVAGLGLVGCDNKECRSAAGSSLEAVADASINAAVQHRHLSVERFIAKYRKAEVWGPLSERVEGRHSRRRTTLWQQDGPEAAHGQQVEEVTWFSCSARYAVLIEGRGLDSIARSVFVFSADDWDPAFERALELGRRQEQEYRNPDDRLVAWRLVEIETLDQLGETVKDGREVYSEIVSAPPDSGWDESTRFDPGSSEPTSSGV